MLNFNGHRLATVFHDAGGRDLVVFCHGFRGVKSGPNRLFVTTARALAERGISSLRFDQYGCGDSEGDFADASFADWIATTRAIAQHYQRAGHRIALFGQSMGGAAVICAASELPDLAAIVAWSPGAKNAPFVASPAGYAEEGGQRVSDAYWREAHEAGIAARFGRLTVPVYVAFGTADEMVEEDERNALIGQAQPNHLIDVFEGYVHSAWTYDQAADIVARSCHFLLDAFSAATPPP